MTRRRRWGRPASSRGVVEHGGPGRGRCLAWDAGGRTKALLVRRQGAVVYGTPEGGAASPRLAMGAPPSNPRHGARPLDPRNHLLRPSPVPRPRSGAARFPSLEPTTAERCARRAGKGTPAGTPPLPARRPRGAAGPGEATGGSRPRAGARRPAQAGPVERCACGAICVGSLRDPPPEGARACGLLAGGHDRSALTRRCEADERVVRAAGRAPPVTRTAGRCQPACTRRMPPGRRRRR